nr:putative insulin-like peptide receptor [Pocillopora verrucosa]
MVRKASDAVMKQLQFPKLTEITGHLLVSLMYGRRSLREIFPNLAVIRGRQVFLDYSLIIYQNDGLEEVNLPSLTTILRGGVRIEKNINLCYVETIRWKSIMRNTKVDEYTLVLNSNNNDCYDRCFQQKCTPPAGHGSLTNQYCWAPGAGSNADCQALCDMKCGDSGCVNGGLMGKSTSCCDKQCLGGCTKTNSPRHCYACRNFRMPKGECVENCGRHLYEIDEFKCIDDCPRGYLKLGMKCVKVCPAGYKEGENKSCLKCTAEKCPRVCKTKKSDKTTDIEYKIPIDSLETLNKYKGCTEIDGNLIIKIRGSGGSGIGTQLEENLGQIEKVKGYIVIRESASLTSLNFFKNLREIRPRKFFHLYNLYNERYALAIRDNPKLEALWPFQQNLTIIEGGIMVHLNPYLCPSQITPLINDILKWNRNDSNRVLDISDTTNGNAVACNVRKINVTVEEITLPRCNSGCVKVEWDDAIINDDYRNVLFYTLSYREAPNRQITEYTDVDACSSDSGDIWTRIDHTVPPPEVNVSRGLITKRRKIERTIRELKPYQLYAFQVEAVVLKNDGAKSDLVFVMTKESKPSQPVGLEANYLNSSALLVTWEPPLFPNGNITKYIVSYEISTYSAWKADLDWCSRQVFSNRLGGNNNGEGSTDNTPDGNCVTNLTCTCDDKEEEKMKPEKQSALFAKEFQDVLYKTLFTKTEDDNEPPTNKTVLATTAPTTGLNQPNCSNNAQNPMCQPTTAPSGKKTTSSKLSSTSVKPTSMRPTVPATKPNASLAVDGNVNKIPLTNLRHFSDYTITVCACTKVGCATGSSCATTKGMTNKNETADNLGAPLKVNMDNNTGEFRLTWVSPKDPNGVVLKYDIKITQSDSQPEFKCVSGKQLTYQERVEDGNYSAQVRAITSSGNGSWSNTVSFSYFIESQSTVPPIGEKEALSLGTIVGASLAASVVFVLACGFVVWYIARQRYKRYSDEQIPGVLYASVNPEYMTSTDVYIPDEWEFPREKIKLVRELGNGSFGMVYEGEAEDITPGDQMRRVAVKTVSENASIRDRVEFLQEASVMKQFCSNHVVRLLGVVSEGQPTLVIMELMELGDLKNFLRSRRPGEGTLPPPTLQELLQMAGEIADGMAYLAARKYVHRDLAARNCMVNADFTVKIGDFGMTRDIYETDYYRKGGKGLLPVRWMAPESLKDGVFTSYSDVWSFGVVMWEMATLAAQPYPGKSNEEVLKYVVDGGVMEKPEECPDRLYELMTLCWQFTTKARPTFVFLISVLENDLSEDFRHLSFYHTLPEDQLKGLLSSHYKHKNRAETTGSTNNVESAA